MPGSLQAHHRTTRHKRCATHSSRGWKCCLGGQKALTVSTSSCSQAGQQSGLYFLRKLLFPLLFLFFTVLLSSNASSAHWVPIAPAPSFTKSSDAQLKHKLHQITTQAYLSLSVMIQWDSYRLSLQKRTLPFLLLLHIAWFYPVSQDGKPRIL